MIRVTAVVPSWNGRELLDMVLPDLLVQTEPVRVLVVDNGSADGSVEHVRSRYPVVELLALERNVGFAAAVNAGMEAAETEFVALFNNDMELERDCVAELVAALDADPRVGSATAKMQMLREPGVLDGAGDSLTWFGGAWRIGHGEPDDGRYDEARPVLSACGGAALYRASALRDVGLFDPTFFAYLEDVDWGVRAQLAGWSCRYVPTAVIRHLGGATSKRVSDLETYLVHRNNVALVVRSLPLWTWPFAAAFQLWTFARSPRKAAIARGWRHAARRLPRTLRSRRDVARRASITPLLRAR